MKIRILLFALLSLFLTNMLFAQSTKEDKKKAQYEQLKAMIDSKRYTFTAQQATAQGGRTKQLTSTYTLKVHQDTLDADLPYFGRAYSATYGSDNGGIQFQTTSFDYDAEDRGDKGWIIVIKPKDQSSASKMTLSLGTSGYGTLIVNSNNRQMISFYGWISTKSK